MLSICIVTHNHESFIGGCLESIIKYIDISNYEIIVVDDHSSDRTVEMILPFLKTNNVKLFNNDKSNSLSFNNNFAASQARGKYLLFMNPDIYFTSETKIEPLINYLEQNQDVGAISALLRYENGQIQESFRRFQTFKEFVLRGILGKFDVMYFKKFFPLIEKGESFSVDWILGAFLLTSKNIFNRLNGFDERYRLYYEDVDFCYRLKRMRKKIIVYPKTYVIHKYHRVSASSIFNKYKYFHIKSFLQFKLKQFLDKFWV